MNKFEFQKLLTYHQSNDYSNIRNNNNIELKWLVHCVKRKMCYCLLQPQFEHLTVVS